MGSRQWPQPAPAFWVGSFFGPELQWLQFAASLAPCVAPRPISSVRRSELQPAVVDAPAASTRPFGGATPGPASGSAPPADSRWQSRGRCRTGGRRRETLLGGGELQAASYGRQSSSVGGRPVFRARAHGLAGGIPGLRGERDRRGVFLARVEVPHGVGHRIHLARSLLALCPTLRALCGHPVIAASLVALVRREAVTRVRGVIVAAPRKLPRHGVDGHEGGLEGAFARDDVVRGVLAHDDVQRVARALVVTRGPTKVERVLAGRRDVDHVLQPGHREAPFAVDIIIGVAVVRQHLHV
eukprot:scaffold19370_cov56-Phaeocystis_antarctica.AAC.1